MLTILEGLDDVLENARQWHFQKIEVPDAYLHYRRLIEELNLSPDEYEAAVKKLCEIIES